MTSSREWTIDQELSPREIFWRDHQKWLQGAGYMLRPRYHPDWKPSWNGTNVSKFKFEDSLLLEHSGLIDARRISDDAVVTLKQISKSRHPSIAKNSRNHCVPVLETLSVPDDPDVVIIVMPLLRDYDSPRFDTYGEVIQCIRQLFEGLRFMHQHHVAHRDCNRYNFMMDAGQLYPEGYHPQSIDRTRDYKGLARHYTRTQRPPKYYLVDFGISRKYDASNKSPLEDPIRGGDKTVPEFQKSTDPCNPFPTDVYYVGNLIRIDFLEGDGGEQRGKYGFEFLRPLVSDMVQDDPAKRPTMDEVVSRFETIQKGLSSWKLRSQVVSKKDFPFALRRTVGHWRRRIGFIIKGVSPLPVPK